MYARTPVFTLRSVLAALLLVASMAGTATALAAQAKVYYACYVPLTGTVYRIKEADVKPACSSTAHIEFSWTDGAAAVRIGDAAGGDLSGLFPNPTVARLLGRALSTTPPTAGQVLIFDGTSWKATTPSGSGGGTADHGALTGLGDDDHLQYLLVNGVRSTTNGFAVTGAVGVGTIPLQGPGPLPPALMWYPGKAAFRVGLPIGTAWEDVNIGRGSVAMGDGTQASGRVSTALGTNSIASGEASTAMGFGTVASGFASTAMGSRSVASGQVSTAMGFNANTSGRTGTFLYADASSSNVFTSSGDNEFGVRAAGGFYFYTNATLTAGVSLGPGAGAWSTLSDVKRKHLFRDESGEDALAKIATMPIRSWSYKSQDPSIRHMGPTAQDFYAAFRLGESDTTITTTDIDGVSLLAIQALERRSAAQARALDAVRAENAVLRAGLADLRQRLDRLESERKER